VTTVAIHQPEYFPWPGFLDKARRADVLVLLDDVQFDRSSLQHRARVAAPNGLAWMTLPFVHRFPQRIDEVELAEDRWRGKHWKTLEACYGRAAGFGEAAPRLRAFFDRPARRLLEVTIPSVELLLAAFGVGTRVLRASALGVPGEKSGRLLALCQALGATRYLSGRTGAAYLDGEAFARAGIAVEIQRFQPPSYPRHRALPGETRGLSALDAWLCLGTRASSLLTSAA
jgi:hypothetical protein